MNWTSIRSNPVVVAAWTAFAGALASQFYIAQQDHHLDFTWGSWEKMLLAAAGTAALNLLHLYTPKPGQPDMPPGSVVKVTPPDAPPTTTFIAK